MPHANSGCTNYFCRGDDVLGASVRLMFSVFRFSTISVTAEIRQEFIMEEENKCDVRAQ